MLMVTVDLDCVNNRSSTKKCSGKRKEYFRQYRQRKRKINSERKSKEQTCKGKRKCDKNSIVVKSFHNDIKFGPVHVAISCGISHQSLDVIVINMFIVQLILSSCA